eukprot:4248079-Pleurochrysis_carterae.AAC.1
MHSRSRAKRCGSQHASSHFLGRNISERACRAVRGRKKAREWLCQGANTHAFLCSFGVFAE